MPPSLSAALYKNKVTPQTAPPFRCFNLKSGADSTHTRSITSGTIQQLGVSLNEQHTAVFTNLSWHLAGFVSDLLFKFQNTYVANSSP